MIIRITRIFCPRKGAKKREIRLNYQIERESFSEISFFRALSRPFAGKSLISNNVY
ncbi:MAG: hypothetical protein LH614_02595 [Pyrinomonadaceae bacterium]|nr:hypothetical protein [Pyrinomonadaceae bacterium]